MGSYSEICPNFGNVIPEWAGGVCYVCVRIDNEYKRYGRRRPVQPTKPDPQKKQAHNKERPKRRTKRTTRAASQQAKPTTKRESERLGKLLILPLSYKEEYGPQIGDRPVLQKGINRFLRAIYGERRYLSDILQQEGFKEKQIGRLRRAHLDDFLQRLVAAWRWWLQHLLSPEAVTLIIRHYSLDGNRPERLAELSADSRDNRIPTEQLWSEALTVLRRPRQASTLEDLVAVAAYHTLDQARNT